MLVETLFTGAAKAYADFSDGILAILLFNLCMWTRRRMMTAKHTRTMRIVVIVKAVLWFSVFSIA